MSRKPTAIQMLLLGLALVLAFTYPVSYRASAETKHTQRIALVIGNAAYQRGNALKTPLHDARLIVSKLARLGFSVTFVRNADQVTLRRAARVFSAKVKDNRAIGFFYYTGHGLRWAGRNYLVPTGVGFDSVANVKDHAVAVDDLMAEIAAAANPLTVMVLDASHGLSLPENTADLEPGVAVVSATRPIALASATAPGEVSQVGAGPVSVFAKNFAEVITQPGLSLTKLMDAVGAKVAQATRGKQHPTLIGGQETQFVLVPKIAASRKKSPNARKAAKRRKPRTTKKAALPEVESEAFEAVPAENDRDMAVGRALTQPRKPLATGRARTKNGGPLPRLQAMPPPIRERTSSGRRPTSVAESDCAAMGELTADGTCVDYDKVLANLKTVPLAYNHPDNMYLGKKTQISLLLKTNADQDLARELEDLSGVVKEGKSKISRIMQAELKGAVFDIDPPGPQKRIVTGLAPVRWSWFVKPLEPGTDKALVLEVSAILREGNKELPPVAIRTYRTKIHVDVKWWDRMLYEVKSLDPLYQLFGALGGLASAGLFGWRIFRRMRGKRTEL